MQNAVSLSAAMKQAERLAQELDRRIDGLEVSSDLRFRLAGGCLDVALEHHKAVVLLIARSLHGSAIAMLRPLFEAYVRGVWLHRCATERELADFAQDRLAHPFSKLVTAVETVEGFGAGILTAARRGSWDALCSFTHTGFLQVVRRNKEATLEPDYDELIQALGFANAIALLAALEIAHTAGTDDLSRDLLDMAKAVAVTKRTP